MEVGDAKDHQAGGKSSKCRVLSGALSNHGRSVIGSVQREGNDGKKCSLSMDHCGSTDSTNESDESECIPIENSITSSSDSSQCNEDEGRGKKAKWRKTSNSASFRSQYNDSKREGKSQKRKKALSSFRSKYDEDKGHGKKVKRCKTSPSTTSGVSSQQAEDEIRGISLNHSRKGKTKQDRSKLRRGKWSLEEDEYTSRIIHYFSTGLLTLPEGATLRSYLADKLNCDPMRITKKYAGDACLGRRMYQFRDRVHPTVAEIQVARAELDHLEQRFRSRIEGGQTASPLLQSPADVEHTLSQHATNSFLASNPLQSQNMLQALLLSIGNAQSANAFLTGTPQAAQGLAVAAPFCFPGMAPVAASAPFGMPFMALVAAPGSFGFPQLAPMVAPTPFGFPQSAAVAASAPFGSPQSVSAAAPTPFGFPQSAPVASPAPFGFPKSAPVTTPLPSIAQLLLPSSSNTSDIGLHCTLAGIQQLQGIDPNIANWAFTQAAASLGPAVLQLVAPHIQQRIQLEAPQLLAEQKGKLHAQINEQQANLQLKVQAQQSLVQASAPEAVQDQQVIKGDQASAFTELKQAYDRHMKSLGFHLSEADDVSSIQNRTSQVGVLVSQMESSSYPSGSLTDTKPPQSTPKQELPSVLKEAPPLLPVKAPASLSLDVATLSPQPPATPRTDEDKEGGTALMGFLSSLRRSYEDVLRAKETFESEGGIRNLDRLSEVSSDRASGYSESSFDSNLNCQSDRAFGSNGSAYNQNTNYRAAINDFSSSQTLGRAVSDWNSDKEKTDPSSCEDSNSDKDVKVTDSSSQQRGSSVEDSDWNSDKKTDPLSSEDSDKEVNERRRRNYSKGPPRKRMKIQRVADEIRKGPTS